MPNFRLHNEKGHSKKKNKKRKRKDQGGSSQLKKKRKLNKSRSDDAKIFLDPKIFGNEFNEDDIIIDTKKKPKKMKKKKKKKMSKQKMKKLAQLKKKEDEKKMYEKLNQSILANRISPENEKLFLKSSQVGLGLTSRQKIERMGVLNEYSLVVPEGFSEELEKKRNMKVGSVLPESGLSELYYKKNKPTGSTISNQDSISITSPPPLVKPPPPIIPPEKNEPSPMTKIEEDFSSIQFDMIDFTETPETFKEHAEELKPLIPEHLKDEVRKITKTDQTKDMSRNIATLIQRQLESGKGGLKPKKFFKLLSRDKQIEEERQYLPILEKEQEIMELVIHNDVVIICGETGSGKTTQVPQFLYEGGFSFLETGYPGKIGITQPRRVAALSTSQRVANEMEKNGQLGGMVGVHIRYFKKYSRKTRILYLTDGILLNEIQSDPMLLKYSVIVLDEAHERNINTDILLGWISRILPYRNKKARAEERTVDPKTGYPISPLKLIIMSATLKVSDFTSNRRLFSTPPPVINVQSRQFSVTVHFNKRTMSLVGGKMAYVRECMSKILKIHRNFPRGDILVFLTGKDEIQILQDLLVKKDKDFRKERKKRFVQLRKERDEDEVKAKVEKEQEQDNTRRKVAVVELDEEEEEEEMFKNQEFSEFEAFSSFEDEEKWIVEHGDGVMEDEQKDEKMEDEEATNTNNNYTETIVLFQDNNNNNNKDMNKLKKKKKPQEVRRRPIFMKVLPLHSNLSPSHQMDVFRTYGVQTRKIVLATNVAETSITITGIRYVIDTGKAKYKHHYQSDQISQSSSQQNEEIISSSPIIQYQVQWCSKSSANQRSGRAGRTCPGHCYRLYSSAVFQNYFAPFDIPEILRAPLESVVLRMKVLGIDYIQRFPFPASPRTELVNNAISALIKMKALRPLTLSERLTLQNSKLEHEEINMLTKTTPLGIKLNEYPLHPRFSNMLLFGVDLTKKLGGREKVFGQYILLLVSVLSSTYPLMTHAQPSKTNREKWFVGRRSDIVAHFCLAGGCLFYPDGSDRQNNFCSKYKVSPKSVREISKMMKQLQQVISKKIKGIGKIMDMRDRAGMVGSLAPPSEKHRFLLRQVVCVGFSDHLAELVEDEGEKRRILGKENYSKMKKREGRGGKAQAVYVTHALGDDVPVFFHTSSFYYSSQSVPPQCVVYKELVRTRNGRICMAGVTEVQREWVTKYSNLDWGSKL